MTIATMTKDTRHKLGCAAAVLAIAIVMIFGPRLDGPRVLFGTTLRTKTGGLGLTNFGFFLLVAAPLGSYALTRFGLGLFSRKGKDESSS